MDRPTIGRVATKSQHSTSYGALPVFLQELRKDAGLTQRQLGKRLRKPQSWVHNCETANRRVDVSEFLLWANACDADAVIAFRRFSERVKKTVTIDANPSGRRQPLDTTKGTLSRRGQRRRPNASGRCAELP